MSSELLENEDLSPDVVEALAALGVETVDDAYAFQQSPYQSHMIPSPLQSLLRTFLVEKTAALCGHCPHGIAKAKAAARGSQNGSNVDDEQNHAKRSKRQRNKKKKNKNKKKKYKKKTRKLTQEMKMADLLDEKITVASKLIPFYASDTESESESENEKDQFSTQRLPAKVGAIVDVSKSDMVKNNKKKKKVAKIEIKQTFDVRFNDTVVLKGGQFQVTEQPTTVSTGETERMYELRFRANASVDAEINQTTLEVAESVLSGSIPHPFPDLNSSPGTYVRIWLQTEGFHDYAAARIDTGLLAKAQRSPSKSTDTDESGNIYTIFPASDEKGISAVTVVLKDDDDDDDANDNADELGRNDDIDQINFGLRHGEMEKQSLYVPYEVVYLSIWMTESQYNTFQRSLQPKTIVNDIVDNDIVDNGIKVTIPGASVQIPPLSMPTSGAAAIGHISTKPADWRLYYSKSAYIHVKVPHSRAFSNGIRVSVPVHFEIAPGEELSDNANDIVTLMLANNTVELVYRRSAAALGRGDFQLRSVRLEAGEVENWVDGIKLWNEKYDKMVPTESADPYRAVSEVFDNVVLVRAKDMYT